MNLSEAAANRELLIRVQSLEMQIKDLHRRLDEHSKANRVIADEVEKSKTLTLKKA